MFVDCSSEDGFGLVDQEFEFPALLKLPCSCIHVEFWNFPAVVFTWDFETFLQLYSRGILKLSCSCIHVEFWNFPAVVFTWNFWNFPAVVFTWNFRNFWNILETTRRLHYAFKIPVKSLKNHKIHQIKAKIKSM